ncbi:MAG: multidrug efflux SMR transporter [Pseudomonadota bacterium]|nr:multidrug efflux SMR transporter [Pseudomonadota bacterium]
MNPTLISYLALGAAIVLEVVGTAFLQKTEEFTKALPTFIMAVCYAGAFYCLSIALRSVPLGIAYAIWAGLGIVLVSLVSILVFQQSLDLSAIAGISLIVIGVITINAFSKVAGH